MDRQLTSEERRIPVYEANDALPPTDAASVTPETPLDDLNLNWRECDLPESMRTRHVHRLHPYLGKFIPQLVEVFLRKYFEPGQTVLDPFCGSGTTLVQACELGINSIGYDISEFNVMLSRVKTAHYDAGRVRNELMDALTKARTWVGDGTPHLPLYWDVLGLEPETEPDEWLRDWYHPKALQQLLAYREVITRGEYEYRDLMKIVLSRAARSARLTTHFELDFPKTPQKEPYYCYKHRRTCQPTDEAFKFLLRYSQDTIRRVNEFAIIRKPVDVSVRHVDSKIAGAPPIDGVITSPPYVGLIDYHEQHIYAYHLLHLRDLRVKEIGAAVNGSGQQARIEYKHEIATVFRNCARALKPGGRMIVIANDKAGLYSDIAAMAGVKEEAVIHRHVNRRTGMRSNAFYESIFVWRKK